MNSGYLLFDTSDIFGILCLGLLFYAVRAIKRIKQINEGDPILKNWLYLISIFFFFFTIASILHFFNMKLGHDTTTSYYAQGISMILIVVLTTYFGQMYPRVFNGTWVKQNVYGTSKGKYQSSGLSPAVSLEYKDRLEELIDKDKLYLDSDLRLMDVARSLGISRHHASQIINQHFNMPFSDFVNRYRILEAKKLILNNYNEHSMLEIAYKAGFNNKVSFYKFFKKFVGATPTEYLENHVSYSD